MKKIAIIFARDYQFQIFRIIQGTTEQAWDIANELESEGVMEDAGIEDYDVIGFDNLKEANDWILEQVQESVKWIKKYQLTPVIA